MTQEQPVDIADTYKQLTAAETQATNLEKMLDAFEAKLDSILQEAEGLAEENGHSDPQENSAEKEVTQDKSN
ncbi:uncharacterized protein LODBEIA_P36220 [Lodderomyces beijingensis]|uniref:EKC/KEOPS complex subunit GON7 n=1 Tax=Lodderomyces beijingensis TaxID=1775926 RepID=A0ABP0ZMP0_9ASCO